MATNMKGFASLLLALALLAFAPTAKAEALLTDPSGDVQVQGYVQGTDLPGLPAPGDLAAASDLVALHVEETEDTLLFTLHLAKLSTDPSVASTSTYVTWQDKQYRVDATLVAGVNPGQDFAFATLEVRRGSDWDDVARLDAPIIDRATGTLTTSVPKVYLSDGQKRVPGRGDVVEITKVETDTSFLDFFVADASFRDQMPDGDGKGASYTLTMGDTSVGSLILSAEDRVRVSNGGATTFIYALTLRHLGDAPASYALAVDDLPAGWNVTLRSPVKVEPKSEKTVNVLVSVPFAHDHGGFSSFNVTARGEEDPASNGRLRLGVLHTPIPQPAGHHSDLYLHARDPRAGAWTEVFATTFPFGFGWMNTQKDDPENTAMLTPFYDGDGSAVWWIPLDPALQVGLDFDLTRTGALVGAIDAKRSAPAEIFAELYYGSTVDDVDLLLAEAEPVTVDLAQSGLTPFQLVLTPTPESDYIPYQPDAQMALRIEMRGADMRDVFNTPVKAQMDVASFKLSLPLNEYHDKLTGLAEAAQLVEILANGAVEKIGRPGTVLTFAFTVKNRGVADTFTFDVAGNDAARARLIPRGTISLDAGESREVTLAIEIPVGANPGEEYEALLFVHSRDDPGKMAIARTKTRVTDLASEATPDESAQLLAAQAREDRTPGVPVPLLLAALGVLGWLHRRRA